MYSRKEWGAVGTVPRDGTDKYRFAVHHTVSPNRTWTKAQEREHMRQLERIHMSQGWSTIGYSWVIFPSGRVYVGRGWTGLPAAQAGYNSGSLAAAFAMNGQERRPSLLARRSARKLIQRAKAEEAIRQLGGHQEFPDQATACPGSKVLPYVKKWRADFYLGLPR